MSKRKAGSQRVLAPDFDQALLQVEGSLQCLIYRYLAHLAVLNYSQETVASKRTTLMLWVAWCADRGLVLASEITNRHLERYQTYLFQYRKANGKPIGFSTQKNRLACLRVFFSWLVKKRYVPANPASDLEAPRPVKRLPLSLSLDEVRRVLSQPDIKTENGLRDRAILELFYSTGMRRAELSRLRVDDVDWSAELIRINQGKGHKDRLVPVGSCALDWLTQYCDGVRNALPLSAGERALFIDPQAVQALSIHQVSHIVHRALRGAGIHKEGCCHLFRHTMATQLLNAGCDMRYIKDMLGHVDINSTAHYAQVAIQQLKDMHRAFHPAETDRLIERSDA